MTIDQGESELEEEKRPNAESAIAPEAVGAVFISYASQDAFAAARIAAALRAAGVEVWFDQSDLRGGDAWDRSIRQQIHDCRLFIAIISAHSETRDEGYFRREWKLAVDRTHDMDERKAFLVPVVIDATPERGAHVPEKFRELQWTRLPHGEVPPAFAERIQRLLAGDASDDGRPKGTVPAPRTRSLRVVYAAAVLAAAALAIGYFVFGRLNLSESGGVNTASIAVLPLANESGDADQRYFSDGISEDLITALGHFTGLRVIGRSSAFQFRDSKEDSRSIGAKLGVAHLVEGSVRKSGNMIRVSAELIDTSDGSMQWSEHYDRPYKDLFALQDEITRAVVAAMQVKLVPGKHASQQSERPPSGNLEAYNAMLEARFYGARGTEADLRKAIEFLTRATVIDPQYAFAWSVLAVPWINLGGQFLEGAPSREAYAKAREAVDRALALSPDLAVAHAIRGNVLQQADLDWRGAEAEYRRALTLAPDEGRAKAAFADLQATLGDVESAIKLMREMIVAEPLLSNLRSLLAGYLWGVNQLDDAEQETRKAIELQPAASGNYWTLAAIEIQRGHAQSAFAVAQKEPAGALQDSALALALQIGPDRSAADKALKTLIDNDAEGAAYQVAEVYALRNDANDAFEWLDRAWNNRDPGIAQLLWDPFMERFKDDLRFAAFCRKVGLPPPGEASKARST